MLYRNAALLAAFCLTVAGTAAAFETVWTDQFSETTYTISGPEEAWVGVAFDVTLTVSDPFYPEDLIAAPWNFQVDGVVHDNGFGVFLTGGLWTEVYTFSFPDEGTHAFVFNAQDMGHGGGAHSWEWMQVGGSTAIVPEDVAVATTTWSLLKAVY